MSEEKEQVPDKEEIERRKKDIKNTMCCPHCEAPLAKWAVPHTLFTNWTNDFMYVCFNDECAYLVRGFEAAARMGNGGSYRLMYDPILDCCEPVPVQNKQALRKSIVDESVEAQAAEAKEIGKESITGNWKLVSSKMIDTAGASSYPLGDEPQGMLVYMEDGTMLVQNMPAEGTLFQTVDGEVTALETYGAYSGRFELAGPDKIVHYIDNSIVAEWNGIRQERTIMIENERLILISPLLVVGSQLQRAHMTWKR